MSEIEWRALEARYHTLETGYIILESRIQGLLITILQNAGIDLLGVFGRIKSFESFSEKAVRKNYADPFEQTEDICGLRVIYYAKSDLEKILLAIRSCGLIIVREEDKRKSFPVNSFGYGAYHVIVRLSEEYTQGDQSALRTLKAEIQITSVTEHLFARISHKADYKTEMLTEENKRRLYRLPGILEIFDDYAETIVTSIPSAPQSQLNAGTLRDFLNSAFPKRERMVNTSDIHFLLQNIISYVDSKKQLDNYWQVWEKDFERIEEEAYRALHVVGKWREDGALRALLELANDKYWRDFQHLIPTQQKMVMLNWRNSKKIR